MKFKPLILVSLIALYISTLSGQNNSYLLITSNLLSSRISIIYSPKITSLIKDTTTLLFIAGAGFNGKERDEYECRVGNFRGG